MNDWIRIAQQVKREKRRARDERLGITCACKQVPAGGRRGVFAIDGCGISHSVPECYVFSVGPQRPRERAWRQGSRA
jgi:hypothetical protein